MSVFGLFDLYNPEALFLLLLIPVWWLWRRHRRKDAIVFSRTAVLSKGPAAGSWIPRAIFILRNVALISLVLVLARPRAGARTETRTSEGINIMLAIDLSSSMLALDFRPRNRLEVAKEKVREFVARRTSDRIGIVAFAGEALTQVPLTTDYRVVMQAVANLQAGQLEDGTAIGTAIATSAVRLRDAPGRSRVMIVLTDGVNNRGAVEPLVAARAAASYGIKIYGVGVGSMGMAPVPVGRNAAGGLRFEYQPVRIDDALLTNIARMTGGRYFRARDAAALSNIYAQIDLLERTPVRTITSVTYSDLYRWPLLLGILALIAEAALVAWRSPLP
ncbi:MAG TPA: VWA domain-containing protein [Gemmatimonadaceae bacterium]|nr:VWA domain-containing protein [Gemmatimonadaceae bacterium]